MVTMIFKRIRGSATGIRDVCMVAGGFVMHGRRLFCGLAAISRAGPGHRATCACTGIVAAVAAAILLCSSGCSSIPPSLMGIHLSVGKPFIIVKSEKGNGWGYFSHPTLYRLPNGMVMVAYNAEGDVTQSARGYHLSEDDGKTWQDGATRIQWDATDGPDQGIVEGKRKTYSGAMNLPLGAYVVLSNRTAIGMDQFEKLAQSEAGDIVSYRIWSADGLTWHGPTWASGTVPGVTPAVALYPAKGLLAPDGSVLCTPYGGFKSNEGFRTILLRSADGGNSWTNISTIATPADAPWGNDGPCEAALAWAPDGALICMMRTGSYGSGSDMKFGAPMLLAVSTNGGITWKRKKVTLSGVAPQLVTMRSGLMVCANGRPGNSLAFSTDNGRTWGHEVALTTAGLRTSGYVDIMEVEPGLLLCVYDIFNTSMQKIWLWDPPDPINVLFGVFVRVDYSRGGR